MDEALACRECGTPFEIPLESESDLELSDPALAPVVVARFSSLQEASLLAARLEEAGIQAWVPEEYAEQVFSGVVGLERLTVRVAAKDYEAAMSMIAQIAEISPQAASSEDSVVTRETGPEPPAITQTQTTTGQADRKLCISCGKPIPGAAELCPECGWTQPPLR